MLIIVTVVVAAAAAVTVTQPLNQNVEHVGEKFLKLRFYLNPK